MAELDAHAFSHRIGRVLRAHGLHGELIIQLFRERRTRPGGVTLEAPFHLRFDRGEPELRQVLKARVAAPDRVAVALEGVAAREQAEPLVGCYVHADPTRSVPPFTDPADRTLGAWVVEEASGRRVGRVVDVLDNGAQPMLQIGDDGALLIPFVEAFFGPPREGPDGMELPLRPIEGLLDLK